MLLENEEKQPKTTSKALRHTIATNLVDEKAVFEAKSEKSKHYKRSWKQQYDMYCTEMLQ